mmetsp:Transcript_19750/g.19862  ORF Transcript_19750/g.19862 Transcript_19750/m.19862 type:complete len:377 (+) Transcript_19750:111-1241(+)|eukprot:CAMPEP_0182424298 /NCGR_PEP_ID=MMETSP1167-20130531/10478_1 /TAXON_ID=2988 /ORGANISM="Mallomonas Sp, Strain CCMP3275" /LENGTH=376 /DNA_ID=CAMNT_0024603991 /DNA_START=104 /DNA_END=1234 /DNA_ORIENTATION=-
MGCSNSKDDTKSNSATAKSNQPVPHVFKAKYKIGDTLGEGAFSVVKLATDKQTNARVAVKCINRTNLPPEDEVSLRQEVEILKSLHHPNVVKCYDFFEEEKYFYVIMEILEGGELFDRIVKKTFYNEKDARDLVFILLSAIKYCHDRGIVHRDLKPENLLLKTANDDADIKLADFGFAVRDNGHASLTTQCGTPGYVAPEILKNDKYGAAVDMWSIGVITYILLGGYPPFQDDNQRALFKKIKKAQYEFHPEYWGAVSDEAKDLISKLLALKPEERLTAEEALKHSWVQRDAKELEARNLNENLDQFKKYVATAKFKAAARAIMALQRMGVHTVGHKESMDSDEPGNNSTPAKELLDDDDDDDDVVSPEAVNLKVT